MALALAHSYYPLQERLKLGCWRAWRQGRRCIKFKYVVRILIGEVSLSKCPSGTLVIDRNPIIITPLWVGKCFM